MSTHDLTLIISVFILTVLLHAFWPSRNTGLDAARLARLEAKINKILDHLGIEHDTKTAVPEGVKELIQQGQKIQAIRLYREQNGTDLRQSKEAVEQIEAQMNAGLLR